MQLGIAIADRDLAHDAGADAVTAVARRVDAATGVHSLWTNETGGADACVTLGAWAAVTERVVLGTGVVSLAARSDATLALAASQVAGMVGPDRLWLGIGVGQRSAAERLHQRAWQSPLAWTESALTALVNPSTRTFVGALGPKMLALAAAKADGALLNWCTPEYAGVMRERFDAAAESAGRDPGDALLCGYVRVAVGDGAAAALAGQAGFYGALPFYAEHWAAMGSPAPDALCVASADGSDLRAGLRAWADAYDVVVARIVPTPEADVATVVDLLCR